MLTGIVLNSVLGGVTGYITNNIAIKMLFKKYLGFGGVIEETKDEFIENISKLIEKDLINHHTLLPEIEKEEFKKAVYEVIKDMITLYLPRNSGEMKISEISGYETTKNNLINFFEETKTPIIFQTKNLYLSKPLNSLISNEQFEFVSMKLTDSLYQKKDSYKNLIFKSIYEILENKKVDEIISSKVLIQVEENLKEIIKNTDFKKFDVDLDNYVDEVMKILDIDMILENVEESINSLKLSEFINTNQNLSKELLNKIITFATTHPEIIEKFSQNLLSSLKNIDTNLYEILDKESFTKMEKFLQTHLPAVISKIIYLIETNKEEIENIINKTIKNHFSSKGSLGELVVSLADMFVKNISDKLGIISKIIEKVEEFGEEAPQVISKEILEFLKSNSISEIIEKIENEGVLNSKLIANMIIHNIKSLKVENNIEFLDEFFDKKVEEIYKVDLSFIKTKTIPAILQKLKNSNQIQLQLNSNVEKFIKEFKNREIKEFIPKIDFNISHSQIENYFYSQKEFLNKKIGEVVEVGDEFDYQKAFELISEKKLNSIYKHFTNEKTYNQLTQASINILKLNLETLLNKNVSIAVSKELNKYESSQIKDMVENFMGKELKPINYLGAGLGAVAGAGYFAATLPFASPYLSYATPLIYGITGVLTNHIAIKMLFEPYEEKRIFGMKVPFTPGVVAKNKPNFAKNISLFVKNDILSDDSLKAIFQNSKPTIETLLNEKISNNDYQIFDKLLKEDKILDKLSNKTFESIIDFIENNSEFLTQKIINFISNKDLTQYKTPLKERLKQEIISINYGEKAQNFIDEFIQNNKNLLEYRDYLFLVVDNSVEQVVEKLIEFLEIENIKKAILNYEKEYNELVENSLNNLVSKNIQNRISLQISNKILALTTNEEIIDSLMDKFLSKEQKLNTLFDGKLVTLLENNIDYMIENMLKMVQSQRDTILSSIELPFLAKFVISDNDIETIVDKLIEVEFPNFIEEKKFEIKGILENLLEYKVEEIGFDVDKSNIKNMLSNITNSDIFRNSLNSVSKSFTSSIMDLKLKEILEILNINNLRQLIELFNLQLRNFIMLSKEQIIKNKEKLIEVSKRDIKKILEDILRENSLQDIFKNVTFKEDISYVADKILSDENFQKVLDEILEDVTKLILNHDIYNKQTLQKDISNFIQTSIKEDKEHLRKIFEPYFKELFLELNRLVDNNSKNELISKIIEAFINSIENNLNVVIKSINLQNIIEKEINDMSPKEIEELFNSFAGEYFNKLKLYGVGGAIFGIPSMFV